MAAFLSPLVSILSKKKGRSTRSWLKYCISCWSVCWTKSKEVSVTPFTARSGFYSRSLRTKFVVRYWIFMVLLPSSRWLLMLWRGPPSGVSCIICCCRW